MLDSGSPSAVRQLVPDYDIFALGKVLYEAATGLDRRSFPELPADLRAWHEHRAVVELNEIVLRVRNRFIAAADVNEAQISRAFFHKS